MPLVSQNHHTWEIMTKIMLIILTLNVINPYNDDENKKKEGLFVNGYQLY